MTVPRASRRRAVVAWIALATAVVVVIGVRVVWKSEPTPPESSLPAGEHPWFGLISPSDSQANQISGGSVSRVVIVAGWEQIEPRPGQFDAAAISTLVRRVDGMKELGYSVVLDLGLQYPPAWVFDLPGETRFVNQYGDAWRGDTGRDVANAVFNTAVRTEQSDYVQAVGRGLGPGRVAEVRVGGLLSGELRYPPSRYDGHGGSIWAFDDRAASLNPVPGWRPGTGDDAATRTALQWYLDSLTRYLLWLMNVTHTAFDDAGQQILLPSWGLRPGMVDAAVADGLDGSSLAERNGLISSGGDWATQVKDVAGTGIRATLYTTWLDAPSEGDSTTQIPPVAYLSGLAARYGLPVAGENTGGGGDTALATCLDQAGRYGLTGVMYMSGSMIDRGEAGLALTDVVGAADRLTGAR